MKKVIAVMIMLVASMAANATPSVYSLNLAYGGGIEGKGESLMFPDDNVNCLFSFSGGEPMSHCLRVGSSFVITTNGDGSRTISVPVTVGPVGPQGVKGDTGLTGATGPAGATDYNLLTNKPSIPAVPVINRTRITTAADGSYSWALPTACASGTTPVVSITPESSTANDAVSHRVVSVTNTTVNVFAGRSAGLTVLSLTVLGVPAGAAIPLHLIAICP